MVFLALAATASAYDSPPNGDGTAAPQFQSPGNGQLILCEDYTIGQPAIGGMCFMSTDKNDLDGSATTAGAPDCTLASVQPEDWCTGGVALDNEDVKDNNIWSRVRVDPASGADGFYRVGTNNHGMLVGSGGWFYYKELLADWSTGGHADFFTNVGSGVAGLFGYEAEFDVTVPGTATCNGPAGTATFKSDTVCTDVVGPADPVTDAINDAIGLVDCILVAVLDFLDHNNPAILIADLTACGP
jgi:hypothetical protein